MMPSVAPIRTCYHWSSKLQQPVLQTLQPQAVWTASPDHVLRISHNISITILHSMDVSGTSVVGIQDKGWKERSIFGKIRYINYAGCKRKFDVAANVPMPFAAVQPKNSTDHTKQIQACGGGGGAICKKKPANGKRQQSLPQAFSSQKAPHRKYVAGPSERHHRNKNQIFSPVCDCFGRSRMTISACVEVVQARLWKAKFTPACCSLLGGVQ